MFRYTVCGRILSHSKSADVLLSFLLLLLLHQAALDFGMGPRASPLVCGYTAHHQKLERALAELKGTEVQGAYFLLDAVVIALGVHVAHSLLY
jgi:7-keto-8-aminopelargonate synthetase-like enzyme